MNQIVDTVEEAVEDAAAAIKPRLRGWLHAGVTPIVLAAGIVLVCLAPTTQGRVAAAVYALSGLILFGTSATYHLGNWGDRAYAALKRADHSNIYIIIAGSYTPIAALTLDGSKQTYMLVGVWAATILGILFRVFWHDAPRALYTALYVALGWSVLPFTIDLFRASPTAATLILAGGILYTIGGVVYGIKRPNPHPTWFGFHEVFHAFTIAAWACHYIAISFLTYQA